MHARGRVIARLSGRAAGAFTIAFDEPQATELPAWWPRDDEDPVAIEEAARHAYWRDRPHERRLLLRAARDLRDSAAE